jgi:hypothetical protein
MPSRILARIAEETGLPRLFSVLAQDLAGSDLQSLLLDVYKARASAVRAAELLERGSRGLAAPSNVDARALLEFDRTAFEVAAGFEAIELSPVAPLGLNLGLGGIDQDNVLTTIRNVEVLGDSTPAMALECARRRKQAPRRDQPAVRLASSARVIRLQPFDVPGFSPHFKLFALASAGRDTGSHAFEIQHLGEHIRFYLELLRGLNARGFQLTKPLVEISDAAVTRALLEKAGVRVEELRESIRAHRQGGSERFLEERGIKLPDAIEDPTRELPEWTPGGRLELVRTGVFEVLRREFPEARFRFNLARLEGLNYYGGLCLRISPEAPDGNRYAITDGGFTDWTARLLEDRKERFLASGIGSEFVCRRYRVDATVSAAEP